MKNEKTEGLPGNPAGADSAAPTSTPTLSDTRVGIVVECESCGLEKKPIGRSAPLGMYLCNQDCPSYYNDPRPGSLWPGESEEDFGYPVSVDGTTDEATSPATTRTHTTKATTETPS
jgi:hypothetical protein